MSDLATRLTSERQGEIKEAYKAHLRAKRLRTALGAVVLLAGVLVAGSVAEVDVATFASGLPRFFKYISNLVPVLRWESFGADLAEWFWGVERWLGLLLDTILIAFVGTLTGAILGTYLSFLAAANLNRSRIGVFVTRRFLEFCRTVPEIVFALIFVVAFGLGALPGVLAITIHTVGALGKLFSEVNENVSPRPIEGVVSTGAGWHATIIFAVLPQVLPNYVSYALLRFEINIRGAAVLGFVGAGGIGQELITAIRQFYYTDISAILVLIIGTVMLIDIATEAVRHRLIALEAAR